MIVNPLESVESMQKPSLVAVCWENCTDFFIVDTIDRTKCVHLSTVFRSFLGFPNYARTASWFQAFHALRNQRYKDWEFEYYELAVPDWMYDEDGRP